MITQTYLRWAIRDVSRFRNPDTWLPVLAEFAPGATLDEFRKRSDFKDFIRIPEPFQDEEFLPRDFNYCVFFCSLALLKRSRRAIADLLKMVNRADFGPPVTIPSLLNAPIADSCKEPKTTDNATGQRVVTVVIDEGIAFAHPRFRRRSGAGNSPECTRIEFIWVQDASGNISPLVLGKEFKASDIDNAVNAARNAGKAEESVYTDLGLLDMTAEGYKPLAHRQAHGTHVLDMASGFDVDAPQCPPLESRPIIAVEMPEASVGDPAGSTLKPHAAVGLVYALWRTLTLRRKDEVLPVVANLSYGPHEGPHDGSSVFEKFVDLLTTFSSLRSIPLLPIFSAGNYRQSRVHANFQLDQTDSTKKLQWRLQPCGLTPSFMEIYFKAGPVVHVTLTPPDGIPLSISTTDPSNTLMKPIPGTPKPSYTVEFLKNSGGLQSFVLAVGPTASDPWTEDVYSVVPSGNWMVEVLVRSSVDSTSVNFDAWIKRSDTPPGRRAKGRQSYFDDPNYQRFDLNTKPVEFDPDLASYVRRENTLSGIATGREPYVIGGYRRGPDPLKQMPTIYTSEAIHPKSGPARVNWLAPSDDGVACRGTLGAGTRAAGRLALNGTSVAAPQAVRYCVDTWMTTGVKPGPIPPAALLDPVSKDVPAADRLAVAGAGLMRFDQPEGHKWKERQ